MTIPIQAKKLSKIVASKYLKSDDFNGLPFQVAKAAFELNIEILKGVIIEAVQSDLVDLVFQFPHPNPHIKAFPAYPPESQVDKLHEVIRNGQDFCLYPTPKTLKAIVDPADYADRPFTLELALGAPQLEFRTFETWVLEQYRNDARFHYRCTDISGQISIRDAAIEGGHVQPRDETFLQQFGFAYLTQKGKPVAVRNRVVAVYLRYLSNFTPEHQVHWKLRQLDGAYLLHPDYYRASIRGQFPEGTYIYQLLLLEIRTINILLKRCGHKPLFKQDWVDEPLPGLAILLRPTRQHYLDFAQLLDKVLSENIDLDFFPPDMPREIELPQKGGKFRVERKGSIALLEEWMGRSFKFETSGGLKAIADGFRRVRRERMPQAHKISEDVHDPHFFEMQRELVMAAYQSVASIRDILVTHPNNLAYKLPHALTEGKVWTI